MKYYIDPLKGDRQNSGTDPLFPWESLDGKELQPGDQALFRRGSVWKRALFLQSGEEGRPITYGAYGEGPDPVVNPSIEAGHPELWQEVSEKVWKYTGKLPGEVCNIVFNDGEDCGCLRWSLEELKHPLEWFYTLLGYSAKNPPQNWEKGGEGVLYLVCQGNPGEIFRSVELVIWGDRLAVTAQKHVVIEHFTFEKSGVHGFSVSQGHHIQIRNCCFRWIGGAVHSPGIQLRFGNAIEFWNGAYDCLVEQCVFQDIYDSGVTHQGDPVKSWVPERLYFRRNLFLRCGMACYEWRGPSAKDVYFENNVCAQGGGAFTMQGEASPRQSEIPFSPGTSVYVLIWRLDRTLPEGENYAYIRGNLFYYAASDGAAISSGIGERAMEQFVIEDNLYIQPEHTLLIQMDGKLYRTEQFAAYQKETGKDQNSRVSGLDVFAPPYVR